MPGATPPRRVLVLAGPNGSGKSTLTTPGTLRHFGIPADRYINADDIARGLTERMPDAQPAEREALAFRRARALRAEMRARRTRRSRSRPSSPTRARCWTCAPAAPRVMKSWCSS